MKKLILSMIMCLCFACNFKEPRRNGEKEVYLISCKDEREKNGYKKYFVKHSEWRSPNIYNSSMWSFRDINGIWIRTNFLCYTNNIKIKIKK
jgi:hypothetical protein